MQGLALWIEEVVALHERARRALRVEAVHDLRVAIRRCRSLAQGLREVDDDDGARMWKSLSDTARPLFQGLGDLRDAQVMREHAAAIALHGSLRAPILAAIDRRVNQTKLDARAAVQAFDPSAWRAVTDHLPARAAALLVQRPLFDHLALRRFHEARALHQRAVRNSGSAALHELRIGVKKLRYTIENFLPDAHLAVGKALKVMQEVLGELHDFDVLAAFVASDQVTLGVVERRRALAVVRRERDARIRAYRGLVAKGTWPAVRECLVDGFEACVAHEALMAKRASTHEGALPTRRLQRCAMTLLRFLEIDVAIFRESRTAELVHWACACALVDGGGKGAQKFVRRLPLAVGFTERDRRMLSVIARAAEGRVPLFDDSRLASWSVRDRRVVVAVGALLHLAQGLVDHEPFTLRTTDDVISIVTAKNAPTAIDFTSRRAPLEAIVHRPLWLSSVEALSPSASRAL